MHIVLSFIGILPEYILYCLYQIRLYNQKIPIYLIYSDYNSKFLNKIKNFNVNLIDYKDVNKNITILNNLKEKFIVVNGLKDRKELFFRSFERLYLLRNLMELLKLEDALFLEIDNLIYDDPIKWFDIFKKENLKIAFMIDNLNRASIGISYFKDFKSVKKITDHYDNFYLKYTNHERKKKLNNTLLNEMTAIYDFYIKNKDDCFILPTSNIYHNKVPELNSNYSIFNFLFDSASYGIYLLGYDTHHTKNKIVLHQKSIWSHIKPSNNIFWTEDNGLKKPYLLADDKKIFIKNLHVHSKDLKSGLSKEFV